METTSRRSGARIQSIFDPSVPGEQDTGVYARGSSDRRASRTAIDPVAQPAPAAALPATAWTPVNVWEFEYPWLEYRRPRLRLRLLGCLLLASLGLAAYVHHAELRSYWVASLDAWPQLRAAWSELELVWTHCQALLVQAWDLYF